MTARSIMTDPDTGIPDLIRRLTDDSKRLVTDEVQLAKLEVRENVHHATRGTLWMVLAFGAGVVALASLTIMLVTLIGRIDRGHYWLGAIVTGIVELGVGVWLLRRGLATLRHPSYTMAETRHSIQDTAHWVTAERR